MSNNESILIKLLRESQRQFPGMAKTITELYKDRLKERPQNGVVLSFRDLLPVYISSIQKDLNAPFFGAEMIKTLESDPSFLTSTRLIAALYYWNVNKNIYKFDAELAKEIENSDWIGSMPMSIFKNLPEPLILLDMQGILDKFRYVLIKKDTAGEEQERETLEILLQDDREIVEDAECKHYLLDYGDHSVEDAINKLFASLTTDELSKAYESSIEIEGVKEEEPEKKRAALIEIATNYVRKILPFLLYMCSYQADIIRVTPEKVKKKNPEMPTKYIVGQKTGVLLKKHRKIYEQQTPASETGRHTRPHIRRGHFRNQWYGSEKQNNRRQQALWIAPVFINADAEGMTDNIKEKKFAN